MKIQEYMAESYERRAAKLRDDLCMPEMVWSREIEIAGRLRSGVATMKGAAEFGGIEFTKAEWKTGQGGKAFVEFETTSGPLFWFPNGKYGPSIVRFEREAA